MATTCTAIPARKIYRRNEKTRHRFVTIIHIIISIVIISCGERLNRIFYLYQHTTLV